MDDLTVRKNSLLQAMSSMKFYPMLAEDNTDMAACIKLPLSKLPSVGIALEPLASAVQSILNGGSASGIYRVTVPAGTHLAELKNGAGNLGTVLNANNQIAGQAVLNIFQSAPPCGGRPWCRPGSRRRGRKTTRPSRPFCPTALPTMRASST